MGDDFPATDPVGPGHDLPDAAALIAAEVAPHAAASESAGVPRATLDRLAEAGLLGTPLLTASAQREVGELLAGSDASTWFCWVQHQTPLRVLAAARSDDAAPHADALARDLLPGLRSGRLLAAVAFAHLRRPGAPNPSATRVAGGWRLDGTLDWVTSWDIADIVLVLARGTGPDAGRIVAAYLPAGRGEPWPGVAAGPVLSLLAMSGTHTRPVTLDAALVPDERVAAVLDREAWLREDAVTSSATSPGAFGVTRGALADLWRLGRERSDGRLEELADALVDEARAVRRQAYAAADAALDDLHETDPALVAHRLRLRAEALDLAVRATTATVVASAGAAMRAGSPAGRRAREALFLQVQAQTAAGRDEAVAELLRRSIAGRRAD